METTDIIAFALMAPIVGLILGSIFKIVYDEIRNAVWKEDWYAVLVLVCVILLIVGCSVGIIGSIS